MKSVITNYTKELSEFLASIEYENVPQEVLTSIRRSILDSIGCCLYGARLPWTKYVIDLVSEESSKPEAMVFGTRIKASVSNAVLANATAGHAFELDDIHTESVLHPGSIAVPVALAFAERQGRWTGRDLMMAILVGYEIGTRVGNAATTSLFFRGFHPQGTSGVFVSAATAARCLGLDARQAQNTLGIAGSQAGGLMAAQEGAMVKRLHAGRAAQSGVYASLLAAKGFTGISNVLEADYGGYLGTYSDKADLSRLSDGLGSTWEASKMGYKLYASVTSIHCALDALKHIMEKKSLSPSDITHVKVGVSRMTHVHCAWRYEAQSVMAAQMNLYYGLAAIAAYGDAFVAEYDSDKIASPAIFEFINRISVAVDDEIEALGPRHRHAAVVSVSTRRGVTHRHRIIERHGSSADPTDDSVLIAKFKKLTAGSLDAAKTESLIQSIFHLDELDDITPLLDILSAAGKGESENSYSL